MAGLGAGYDLSTSTFSPDGRVFQVEYATKAVDNGSSSVAFCCSDGVVFGIEKPILSPLLVPDRNRRVFAVDTHIGIVASGLLPDAHRLVERARHEAASFRKTYGEPIPCGILAQRLGLFVHAYTLYWSVRPFGAGILLCGLPQSNEPFNTYASNEILKERKEKKYSQPTPEIYCIQPNGTCYKYFGMAIGKGRQTAKTELEKLDLSTLTCKEGLFHLSKILHQIHESTEKRMEVEMGWICTESDMKYQLVPKELLDEAKSQAQEYLTSLDE